jgi:hypothetical protein
VPITIRQAGTGTAGAPAAISPSAAALFGPGRKELSREAGTGRSILLGFISGRSEYSTSRPFCNRCSPTSGSSIEPAYVYWTKRFVRFFGLRHPSELGPAEVRRFLTHLVVERHLSAATQQQALSALLFLYRNVLGRSLEALGRLPRGRVPTTLLVVLTPAEVARVLKFLRGTHRLVGLLLYGSGLRVTECLMLRVKDLDLERGEFECPAGQGQGGPGHRHSRDVARATPSASGAQGVA